mmetsp:Transcript_5764/g.6510  ORF Transcript_5764/g.6510 Transcript_5764/m.6510 type:complete len:109 (+) Transcript_5764:34-360(+)
MWKKGKSEGPLGVKSLMKQTRQDLKSQGVDLIFDQGQDEDGENQIQYENILLKGEINQEEMDLVESNLKIRETIHKSYDYILFSKAIKPIYSKTGCAGLEQNELKKKV